MMVGTEILLWTDLSQRSRWENSTRVNLIVVSVAAESIFELKLEVAREQEVQLAID